MVGRDEWRQAERRDGEEGGVEGWGDGGEARTEEHVVRDSRRDRSIGLANPESTHQHHLPSPSPLLRLSLRSHPLLSPLLSSPAMAALDGVLAAVRALAAAPQPLPETRWAPVPLAL